MGPEVPLSKPGPQVAARLLVLRDGLLPCICNLLLEEITTLDERFNFMDLKRPFPTLRFYVYNFISIWEMTLIIASEVASSELLNFSILQFLNFPTGLLLIPTSKEGCEI